MKKLTGSEFLLMLVCLDLLRTRYAPHLLFTEFRETLEGIQKIIKGMTTKVEINSKPPIFAETEAVDESEPDIADKSI